MNQRSLLEPNVAEADVDVDLDAAVDVDEHDGEHDDAITLDGPQQRAVDHGEGALIIAAGAGTGKTRVLTARVARLLAAGVPPERILLLTFTRRAAAAMTGRAAALSHDPQAAQRIAGGTFHAVAHRVIAEHAQHVGLSDVTVLDPNDVDDLLDLLRAEHGLDGAGFNGTGFNGTGFNGTGFNGTAQDSHGSRLPTTRVMADIGSRAVNTGTPARTVIAEQFPWALDHADRILSLLRAYAARKRERGLLDLDDLLLYWRALVLDPDVGARLRARWDWVLVDEYQDVNRLQVDIVRGLCPDGRGLTVVGDDAQAIYGFRGANAGHLLELASGLEDATVVRLERNFRSTQPVLDLANVVRPGDLPLQLTADRGTHGVRPTLVVCENADDEARAVADAVLAAHLEGLPLREQAVLMRTGSHSAQLEVELRVRDIPFHKFGGIGYLETAHVRDLLAAMRVALNPADEVSWYRLLTRHRAIGKVSARRLARMLADTGWDGVADVIAAAPPKARTSLQTTLSSLAVTEGEVDVAAVVEACVTAVEPLLGQHYPDWQRRAPDVQGVAEAAARQSDLRRFVAEQAIDPVNVSSDWAKKPHLDEDWLTLSTVHSAKGLEWNSVHVLRASDGAFPSDMALSTNDGLAEEQRLFYVAATRARDDLRVYAPARLPTHPTAFTARHVIAKQSRFLTPEARAVMTVEDRHHTAGTGGASSVVSAVPAGPRITVDTMGDLFA